MEPIDKQVQLVTFQLGNELYGVDIREVKEIVKIQQIRQIPSAPSFMEGIFNLRGEIIPIINLHKRLGLGEREKNEEDEFHGGFIILNIENVRLGIIIDRIARVILIPAEEVTPPPQMLSGVGRDHIFGVVRQESEYLIILDLERVFTSKEIQQLADLQSS
ncbi:MAG: chemotaxis protein CheW [Treponemataceae bacterium]